ncbi:chloride channel protein [Microvirga rosea]|uniref:chloride channel protein n=1 Tax=Microvirga rosea TaxID=2715425 RepID=UPI001D0A0F2F|nr:chloride channel protein [Microvirga rosea]MCB8822786.1 chloride channel protein [Microvirga rosea]
MLAAFVGVLAGIIVSAMGFVTRLLHSVLFDISLTDNLSALSELKPGQALVPAIGGCLVGLSAWLVSRYRTTHLVDPIEANALHGGRLSLSDSVIVGAQTILSNGFGASVGLEAGYTQMGSGIASWGARQLNLRRSDVRVLVGCGAAGAIASAFNAPFTGAFYGFELIIGVYSVATVAPVMAATLAAVLVTQLFHTAPNLIEVPPIPELSAADYFPFLILGLVAGAISVGIMRLVTLVERAFVRTGCPPVFRPAVGGFAVGGLALFVPQVLSAGHGALHIQLEAGLGLGALVLLFAAKVAASAVSLGSGFRGGLFFASLLLGALLGKIFAIVAGPVMPLVVDPVVSAIVGMASLAVGIVGGPLTITFLALETTGDLAISGIVLTASIMAAIVVRQTFGYSFSTWRLHLRGETIRSAQDVGWLRNLTVGRMMRRDVKTIQVPTTLADFRRKFPLGSAQRVVAADEDGHYAGIVLVPEAYAAELDVDAETSIAQFLRYRDDMLVPAMNVKEAASIFDQSQSEELAVVDNARNRKVLGLLTESHLLRRYSEELDKAHRGALGEETVNESVGKERQG